MQNKTRHGCFSKAMSNGYPSSAIGTRDVMDEAQDSLKLVWTEKIGFVVSYN